MTWYYQVETEPGQFTPGKPRPTLALARAFWASVPLAGRRCLDIGTQEGVMSVLMARAGGVVTATDITSRLDKIDPLRARYEAEFRYVADITLAQLATALDHEVFDIVNFAGVLYHSINPLGCLALARARCRVGGLMLVETAAIQKAAPEVAFNANGALGVGEGTYFMPSTTALEYWLRMVGLEPLAAAYDGKNRSGAKIRVAVLCRSKPCACPRESPDACMTSMRTHNILKREGGLDWEKLNTGEEIIEVGDFETGIFPVKDIGLYDAIAKKKSLRPTRRRTRLELDAQM